MINNFWLIYININKNYIIIHQNIIKINYIMEILIKNFQLIQIFIL